MNHHDRRFGRRRGKAFRDVMLVHPLISFALAIVVFALTIWAVRVSQ